MSKLPKVKPKPFNKEQFMKDAAEVRKTFEQESWETRLHERFQRGKTINEDHVRGIVELTIAQERERIREGINRLKTKSILQGDFKRRNMIFLSDALKVIEGEE